MVFMNYMTHPRQRCRGQITGFERSARTLTTMWTFKIEDRVLDKKADVEDSVEDKISNHHRGYPQTAHC